MFPLDFTQKYFDQLTAERPKPKLKNGKIIGYEWDAGGRSNEALDCMCYAIMAYEVFMNEVSLAHGEESTNYKAFWIWATKKFKKAS